MSEAAGSKTDAAPKPEDKKDVVDEKQSASPRKSSEISAANGFHVLDYAF